MELKLLTYLVYLVIALFITIWTANALYKNGHRFLLDIYNGDEDLASSVNNLLRVGFYLLNALARLVQNPATRFCDLI